jgi:hypothetical protein
MWPLNTGFTAISYRIIVSRFYSQCLCFVIHFIKIKAQKQSQRSFKWVKIILHNMRTHTVCKWGQGQVTDAVYGYVKGIIGTFRPHHLCCWLQNNRKLHSFIYYNSKIILHNMRTHTVCKWGQGQVTYIDLYKWPTCFILIYM